MEKELESRKTGNGSGDHLEPDEDAPNQLINSESRTPLKTPSKETEVKFIVNDSINGDAKIDIEHVKSGFAGMSKDELLKYVNDPFWRRIRTILFISFWLIWVMMFIAAIAIIVLAPRCEAPARRKWYQEGPIMNVNLLNDGTSLANVAKKLDYMVDLKTKGIILSPVFPTDGNGNVVDFKSVSKDYGTLDDLKTLLALAKEKAVRILLSLVPNHSSLEHEWFNKSVAREAPYDEYYVWARQTSTSPDGTPMPPNNWLSTEDGSAWTWHPIRQQFYLHQFSKDQPDLNFNNPLVLEEMKGILNHWLSLGVSGFSLDKVQYLLEDPELSNEAIGSQPGPSVDQYKFWGHVRTYNRPGVAELLSEWRDVTRTATDSDGILIITGEAPIAANMNQTSMPDLVRAGPLTADLKGALTANSLAQAALNLAGDWPALEAVTPGRRLTDLGEAAVDPLNIVTMLLPGTPITQLGDEQGLTEEEAASFLADGTSVAGKEGPSAHMSIYKTLAHSRDSHSILYGALNVTVLNETAFVLARWRAGYPGFVAVWNASPGNISVDLSGFAQLPPELTVVASGDAVGLPENARVPTERVPLVADAAAVFTFVPAG